ncbi:unnamed protein product [Trichogramma brassicae]|uniref:Uncharacterized protein n=1 Tax=Trichogramma brassicae TaxID=86971 RepID=A0A6H5IQN2_9HYME|nr:unnamed protein product [Trichogramma brassicae]
MLCGKKLTYGPDDDVIRRARQFLKIGRIGTNETAYNAVASRPAARRTPGLDWTGNTSSRPSSSSRRSKVIVHRYHLMYFKKRETSISPSEDPKVGSTFLVRPISRGTASHSPRSRDLRGKEKPCTSVRCTSGFALEVHLQSLGEVFQAERERVDVQVVLTSFTLLFTMLQR